MCLHGIIRSILRRYPEDLLIMSQIVGLIRIMRPKQWIKNGFVFVPLWFDRKVLIPEYLIATLIGFVFLCLTSSTVYIINDLADIEADKAHPSKRDRPLPSGQLSRSLAIIAAVLLPILILPVSYILYPSLAWVLAGYLVLQILYTFILKNVVIIDVMAIAGGFLLRVAAGVVLVDVERFSPWLYLFTTMLALFLGFAKRRQEIVLLQNGAKQFRPILQEYSLKLLDNVLIIISTTTIITYALYTFSAEGLPENHLMMLTIPFVLYGIFRYLYLIHVKDETRPPDEVALTDRPIQGAVGLFFLTVFLILYMIG